MKKLMKMMFALAVGLFAVIALAKPVSAKTHYNMTYDYWGTEVSMNQRPVAAIYSFSNESKSKKADFDKNGKKETVTVKNSGKKMYVYINGKTATSFNTSVSVYDIEFETYRIGKNTFAVLFYGVDNGQGSNGRIYRWKSNKLTLLKKCSAGNSMSYLDIGVKNGRIIVKNQRQLMYSEWTQSSTLLSKYGAWRYQTNASVTKTYYTKYKYTGGKLKKSSQDIYYRITGAYD